MLGGSAYSVELALLSMVCGEPRDERRWLYAFRLCRCHFEIETECITKSKMEMKRFITPVLFAFTLILCIGCQSNEEKSSALIQKYLLKELHNYDSYTQIESNFEKAYNIPLNNSICRQHATNIVRIRNNYQDGMKVLTHQLEEAGLIAEGEELSGYSKESLNRYPEILETKQMIDNLDPLLSNEISQLSSQSFDETEYIGYSVNHKFQYKDSAGNPATGNYYFLFDKELKNILFAIDLDDETNKSMISVLNQFCPNRE